MSLRSRCPKRAQRGILSGSTKSAIRTASVAWQMEAIMLVGILVIVAIVAALVVWFISIYNNIVTKDNRCDNAWQTIDAQLQRRNTH